MDSWRGCRHVYGRSSKRVMGANLMNTIARLEPEQLIEEAELPQTIHGFAEDPARQARRGTNLMSEDPAQDINRHLGSLMIGVAVIAGLPTIAGALNDPAESAVSQVTLNQNVTVDFSRPP